MEECTIDRWTGKKERKKERKKQLLRLLRPPIERSGGGAVKRGRKEGRKDGDGREGGREEVTKRRGVPCHRAEKN